MRQNPRFWSFFTVRGSCLFLLSLYFAFGPSRAEYDIIATVLAYCFGLVCILAALGTWTIGTLMRQRANLSFGLPQILMHSGEAVPLSITVTNGVWFPFFSLRVRLHFDGLADELSVVVPPTQEARTTIVTTVSFPHRGVWTAKHVQWEIVDDLGIFIYRATLAQTFAATIYPPEGFNAPAPIVSSCLRDGDAIPNVEEPRGDYYDLRAYHPADGMRKIVWKIYARTGELLSRHPEKTMTPEGKVLMVCLAGKPHDSAARLTINYASYLIDAGLEVACVCLGQGNSSVARTEQAVTDLVVSSANAPDGQQDLSALIRLLREAEGNNDPVTHIVLLAETINADEPYGELLVEAADAVTAEGMTPVFIVAFQEEQSSPTKHKPFVGLVRQLFIEENNVSHSQLDTQQLLRTIHLRGWDTHPIYR